MRILLTTLSRFYRGSAWVLGGTALTLGVSATVLSGRLDGALQALLVVCGVAGALSVLAMRRAMVHRFNGAMAIQRAERDAELFRFDTAINNMSQGLCFFDGHQRLIVCNHRYADMYRLSRELVRPGTTLREIVDFRYQAKCMPDMSRDEYIAWRDNISISDRPSTTVTTLVDGRTISIHHQPMADGGWVSTHEDISESRRRQAEVEHLARHDALTGLPNRVLFRERLNEAARAHDRASAVMCLDLDRFKEVNDTLGHDAGDELLRMAAGRLSGCVRDGDVVARLGGDEFAIIQAHGDQPGAVQALATRLLQVMEQPFDVAGHQMSVGISIGITLCGGGRGEESDDLLKQADLALYDAKSSGRSTHRFFRPDLERRATGRRELEVDLRQAIELGALALHYQPLVSMFDGCVEGFEALVRWPHPERGMIMPDQFIALAEEVGLIDALGAWVLAEACHVAVSWPAPLCISVNLSPLQLRSGRLLHAVRSALEKSGLAAERLELEITESVPLDDHSLGLATLHELRAMGVRISIDDFGAGFSSVSYLRRFPFDKIKMDRSLVRDVASDQTAQEIVRAMASLGVSLGMAVTAEGVETMEQLDAARRLGCSQAQGYLISTPRPAAELAAILRRDMRLVGSGTRKHDERLR
jgi:diguanylate cyclase (GGDEF)-like protein